MTYLCKADHPSSYPDRSIALCLLIGFGLTLLSMLAFSGQALADLSGDHGQGYGHMGWADGGGMMLFGPVMMIGLVVVIVLVVVSLMKHNARPDDAAGQATSSALVLLNERYAKGEIDHAEYEERKRRLVE